LQFTSLPPTPHFQADPQFAGKLPRFSSTDSIDEIKAYLDRDIGRIQASNDTLTLTSFPPALIARTKLGCLDESISTQITEAHKLKRAGSLHVAKRGF